MSDASRDQNHIPSALGVSSADSTVTLPFKIDSSTGRLLTDSASGSGDVVGPASATDNAVARFDGITGKLIQNSVVVIGDTGAITGALSLNLSGLTASQIVGTDGSSNLVSLAVATYPSLTELTYVKGVTSAIQTQLNTKGAGTVTAVSIATANGFSGSSSGGATPALTIVAGAIVPTTVNGLTISTTTGTFTLTAAKTFVVTHGLTLSGTDSTIMTFPTTSATIARTDAANTFAGNQTFSGTVILGTQSITMTGSIAATGARVTKVWTADIESTNMPTVGGVAILTSLTAPQFTTIELGAASDTTLSRVSAGVIAVEGVTIPTLSSSSTLTNKTLTAPIIGGAASLADGATISKILPTVDGTATGPVTSAFVSGYSSSAIGDLVYLDSSGKWQKTDADSTTTAYGLLGIALAVAATDAALLVALPGAIVYATAFPTLTIGATYYLGETAGAIQSAIPTGADNVIRVVGFGVHADKLFFLPSSDVQTTVA